MDYRAQVVLVHWGKKYKDDIINHTCRSIVKNTTIPIRFVCITNDSDRKYDSEIEIKTFPHFSVPLEQLMTSRCEAKLAMFARGMLREGLPTIYLDLDTMVRGDIARLIAQLEKRPGLYMLRNHYIPLWRIQNYVKPLLGKYYYFGNSSVLAFYPERCYQIFDDFNTAIAGISGTRPRHLRTDERFISYCASEQVKVFPKKLAVKFTDEYMVSWLPLEDFRPRLPWVRARRDGLVAITFASEELKPWFVSSLKNGDIVTYKNKRRHRWVHPDYSAYWRKALEGNNTI